MNLNKTSWNLYKCFVVVYETGNLHRAADILGVTRAAVRQNIRELGYQLGVTLFTPHAKGVTPTGDATGLYPNIKKAVELIVGAENSVEKFTSESEATLKIATSNTHVMTYLKNFLCKFYAKYPKVKIEFFSLEKSNVFNNNEIDFVLDIDSLFAGSGFKTIDLFSVRVSLFASKDFIGKNDLDSARIISAEGDADIKTLSLDMTYQLVKNSLGVGYLCRELLDEINDKNLIEVSRADYTPETIKVVCGYKKSLSKPARVFVDELAKFVIQ
jgi:DNA-binding transcriptional LysR family regulator